MTEIITRFKISELGHLRVRCKACGTVTEVSVENLKKRLKGMNCVHCDAENFDERESTAFSELQEALRKLNSLEHCVEVEFVLSHAKEKS